jgi:uncharacterized protein YbjT (DUF2867 family)
MTKGQFGTELTGNSTRDVARPIPALGDSPRNCSGIKTATIFGATGLVGSLLLHELLNKPEYAKVIAFSRRDLGIDHPKLQTRIGDINTLAASEETLQTDDLFLALGSNRQRTPDQQEYYRIDHDYPLLAAKRAQEGGAKCIFLLSALGANPSSRAFYFRTKGETERDIVALGYEQTYIFRPSMILGHREQYGPFEKTMSAVWTTLNPLLIGALDEYRAIRAEDIAKAMVGSADLQQDPVGIYKWREMNRLLHRSQR